MDCKLVVLAGPAPLMLEGLRLIIRQHCGTAGISCDIEVMPADPAMLVRALSMRRPDALVLAFCSGLWDLAAITAALGNLVPRHILALTGNIDSSPDPAATVLSFGVTPVEFLKILFENQLRESRVGDSPEKLCLPAVLNESGRQTVLRLRSGIALTDRQKDILGMLAMGMRLKAIAHELRISPRTVEFHKYKLMSALGVSTVVDLVRYAMETGLLARKELLDGSHSGQPEDCSLSPHAGTGVLGER